MTIQVVPTQNTTSNLWGGWTEKVVPRALEKMLKIGH